MRELLLGNLATKGMALLLALVTWAYLYTQGIGTEEIVVEFRPQELDPLLFASVTYRDSAKNEILPGSPMRVRLGGAKGDVRSHALRPQMTFKCEPSVDPKTLAENHGSLALGLERKHFSLPGGDAITVTPVLPSPVITLQYSRYVEKTIDLGVSKFHYDGELAPGFRVDSITASPPRIRARVPADRADEISRFDIKRVYVGGQAKDLLIERWELDPLARVQKVLPVQDFRVEVKIVPNPKSKRINGLRVGLNALPEVQARVKLETTTVDIEIQGPEDLVEEASKLVAAFSPYIVVSERDLEPPGPKNISEIGCWIQDPRFRGKLDVVVMPNEKPENRQVKITVAPK